MSIDYGRGMTNIDHDTGIRYGVIPSCDCGEWFFETMESDGVDVDYRDWRDDLIEQVQSALHGVLSDYLSKGDIDGEEILDSLQIEYPGNTGDCTRYEYDADGIHLQVHGDGDVFVLKSPCFALCTFCSPCAPGAGYLKSEGSVKAYCLPADWFDGSKVPHDIYSVETGELIAKKSAE